MLRAFFSALLIALFLIASGCDATLYFSTNTLEGSVSQVRLTVISDASGTSWQVTIITLQTVNGPSRLTACGNQVNRFPMDSSVSVKFTPSTPCASNVVVTIRS
jgi:hypothetical protein